MVTQLNPVSNAVNPAPNSSMRLLIVEDDRESADYLVKAFREVGHVADLATDGEEGLALADSGDYDVLVVDRMLPKRDGLSLIGTLREKGNRTPALILSALGQVDDRIKGLRAGGDDYLPKPYSFAELLARVEVLSRRNVGPSEETTYRVGDLELISADYKPLAPGHAVTAGIMTGRARLFAVERPFQPATTILSIAMANKCDAIVATVVAKADVQSAQEDQALNFLRSAAIQHWVESQIGSG